MDSNIVEIYDGRDKIIVKHCLDGTLIEWSLGSMPTIWVSCAYLKEDLQEKARQAIAQKMEG